MSVSEFTAKQLIEHWIVVFICTLQLHSSKIDYKMEVTTARHDDQDTSRRRRAAVVDEDHLIQILGRAYGFAWGSVQSAWQRRTVLGSVIVLLHCLLGFAFHLIYAPSLYHLAITVFAFVFLIVATKASPLSHAPDVVWKMIILLYTLMLITAYMAIVVNDAEESHWVRSDPNYRWTNIRYLLGDTFLLLSIISLRSSYEHSSDDTRNHVRHGFQSQQPGALGVVSRVACRVASRALLGHSGSSECHSCLQSGPDEQPD